MLLHLATFQNSDVDSGELLEIMGSIINGFALPLKEEHKETCSTLSRYINPF